MARVARSAVIQEAASIKGRVDSRRSTPGAFRPSGGCSVMIGKWPSSRLCGEISMESTLRRRRSTARGLDPPGRLGALTPKGRQTWDASRRCRGHCETDGRSRHRPPRRPGRGDRRSVWPRPSGPSACASQALGRSAGIQRDLRTHRQAVRSRILGANRRCLVHFARNLLAHAAKLAPPLRSAFGFGTAFSQRRHRRRIARDVSPTSWPSRSAQAAVSCRRLSTDRSRLHELPQGKGPQKTSHSSEADRHGSMPHSRHSLPSTSRRDQVQLRRNQHGLAITGARQRRRSFSEQPDEWPSQGTEEPGPSLQFQNRDGAPHQRLASLAPGPSLGSLLLKGAPAPIASRAGTRLHSGSSCFARRATITSHRSEQTRHA